MPIVSAGRCTVLPYVDNTMLVGDYTSEVQSTATFVCHEGYRFSDGSTEKAIMCQPDLEWENLEACTREFMARVSCILCCGVQNLRDLSHLRCSC